MNKIIFLGTSLVVVATLQQLALFFVFYFVYYSLFWFLHAKPKLLASSTAPVDKDLKKGMKKKKKNHYATLCGLQTDRHA